jgi:dolichol-phosphate mannosyltransferase
VYISIPHQARADGKSSYTFRSRFRLAYNCILSFSDYPLKLMTGVGLGTVVLGLLWGAYAAWVRLTDPTAQTGFASLLSAIVVFGGLNLAGLGVASLYIGRILIEVQRRPNCVIRSVFKGQESGIQTASNGGQNAHESIYIS